MEKFLKDRSYYENLYERKMIKKQKSYHDRFDKSIDNKEKAMLNLISHVTKMSDYAHRDETINKWMEQDRKSDEFYEKAQSPRDIVRCRICNSIMDIEDKDFCHGYEGKPDRVLFLYMCGKCNKGRAFYNNGEEFETKKDYCDKCGGVVNYTANFNGEIC